MLEFHPGIPLRFLLLFTIRGVIELVKRCCNGDTLHIEH